MSLGGSLTIVMGAFLAIIGTVMTLAFRERRAGKSIAATDHAAQHASDARVMAVVFGSVIGGKMLTLITAWLVFF